MKPIKLIFCTDGIFPLFVGGMQRHSRLLIEELGRRNDIEIIIIHPHNQHFFGDFENIKEITIANIRPEKNYLIECYKYSKRVFKEIENYPEYLVYAQGLTVWYGIKRLKNRLIINPHGLEPFQALSLKDKVTAIPFRTIFSSLFNNASYVISLGGSLTTILKKTITSNTKIEVLPNAVNIPLNNQLREWDKSKLNILFASRFASNKGINILINAIEELNQQDFEKKLTFNLVGKGPLFEYYSTNYKFSNVNYLGFVADDKLESLYQDNDLFVLPTLFEGMPTVVLEAMSHKMPVVVSDVGATAELVDDTNGYLIKKNNVGALKKAILSFYHLPAGEKEILSQKSYQKVKSGFTWEQVAKKHVELFEKMISKSF